jgi:hypothetical protein
MWTKFFVGTLCFSITFLLTGLIPAIISSCIYVVTAPFLDVETVEDDYQMSRIHKTKYGNGAFIHIYLNMGRPMDTLALKSITKKLNTYKEKYNFYNPDYYISNNEDFIFLNEDDFIACHDFHYKFHILSNNEIHAIIRHELIGGSFLLELFYCFLEMEQRSTESLFPCSNSLYSLGFIPLYFSIPKIPDSKKLPLFTNNSDIQMYINTYVKNENKNVIMYNALQQVLDGLPDNFNRPLIGYIPIAFQPYHNVRNNIGLIWFSITKQTTQKEFEKQLTKNQWHSIVTNACIHTLPLLPSMGSKVRSNVDIVVSFMVGKDNHPLHASWTFCKVSEYPFYLALCSVKTDQGTYISETLTVSTPNFKNEFYQK